MDVLNIPDYALKLLKNKHGDTLNELLETLKNHIFHDFYNQFIEINPQLTDEHKKIVMFFSDISNIDAANMALLLHASDPDDPNNIREVFYKMFFERTKIAVQQYLTKVFFTDAKYSEYGNDIVLDAQIDQFVDKLVTQYDYISPEVRDVYKKQGFYASLQKSYISMQSDIIHELLKKAVDDEFVGKFIYANKMPSLLYSFCADQSLRFAHRPIHEDVFTKQIQRAIQDIFANYATERSKIIRQKKIEATNYLNREFFANHKKRHYGMDKEFDEELATHVQSLLGQYDRISSSIKNKYKTTGFHTNTQMAYIQHYISNMQKILSKEEDLFDTDIDRLSISKQIHTELYKDYVKKTITAIFVENDTNRKKRIDEENKKLQTSRKSTQVPAIVPPRLEEERRLTAQQEQILQQLETKMLNRVKIDMQYITRMLKKGGPIYVESLVEDMGSGYSQELLEEVVGILQQFDVEIITRKDKEIRDIVDGGDNLGNNKNTGATTQVQIGSIITGLVLDVLLQNPEKLTGSVLLVVLEKSGYKFISKKDFLRQAEDILGIRERKSALPIQKKMVDALRMGENVRDRRKSGKGRNCASYEVLVFETEGIRLVKQGKTICWLLDHDAYEKKINIEFTQNNNDYSAIADNTSTHLLVKGGDSTRYTPEQGDHLSGAC